MAEIFTVITGIFLAGFGYGIYQIAKREKKPDHEDVPDDSGEIGELWNTMLIFLLNQFLLIIWL